MKLCLMIAVFSVVCRLCHSANFKESLIKLHTFDMLDVFQ